MDHFREGAGLNAEMEQLRHHLPSMKLMVILLATSQLSTLFASEIRQEDPVDSAPVTTSSWIWGAIGAGGSMLRGATSRLAGVVLPTAAIDPEEEPNPDEEAPKPERSEDDGIYAEKITTEPAAEVEKQQENTVIEELLGGIENVGSTIGNDSPGFVLPTTEFPPHYQTQTIPILPVPEASTMSSALVTKPIVSDNTAGPLEITAIADNKAVTAGKEPQSGFCKVFHETTEFKEKQSKMFWMICGLIALLVIFPVPLTYYFMVIRRSKPKNPV